MLVKFIMSTQSYVRGSVVELPNDDSLHSLLSRGIVQEVKLETKPEPELEVKPEPEFEVKPKRGRPRKVKADE
jgi:hypothetical protein